MTGKRMLITGGAGFIGCNAARFFGERNWNVTVLDNLSRPGTEKILQWLREGTTFDFAQVDVRDRAAVDRCLPDEPVRCGASSCRAGRRHDVGRRPAHRFCRECLRHIQRARCGATLLSGSRVHLRFDQQGVRQDCRCGSPSCGAIGTPIQTGLTVLAKASRSTSCRLTAARKALPINTCSILRESTGFPPPHSVSRASTDRASSAWRTRAGSPGLRSHRCSAAISPSIGDGKQVRDVLHVDDLVRAYEAAIRAPEKVAGEAFNVGGGPDQVISLIDLIEMLEKPVSPQDPAAMGRLASRRSAGLCQRHPKDADSPGLEGRDRRSSRHHPTHRLGGAKSLDCLR